MIYENRNLICKIAFTLAETLIVMGVIGVVAALTLPNLNQSTGNKEKVAKLQKIYSNLQDAYGRAEAVYGPFYEWFTNDSGKKAYAKRAGERITEFMKISKNCEFNEGQCFPEKVPVLRNTNGSPYYAMNDGNGYSVITADGMSARFYFAQDLCNKDYVSSTYKTEDPVGAANSPFAHSCGYIQVDIDGLNKGPNIAAKDVFYFYLNKDGLYPGGAPNQLGSDISDCFIQGATCTYWVINNGNMDYLKADSNGKCNNSDITLSWTNTSCN